MTMAPSCCSLWVIPPAITIILALVLVLLEYFVWSIGHHKPPITLDYEKSHGLIVNSTMRRDVIVDAFQFAWNGYYSSAWPHDELKPVSNTVGRSHNDWGLTAVDALSTAVMMGQGEIVRVVLNHIKIVDLDFTDAPISVSDNTVRYMGSMLSAYELLNGPYKKPFGNWSLDTDVLLKKAQSLGDMLMHAFANNSLLPSDTLDSRNLRGSGRNDLAGAGTLLLEWSKLTELTKNPLYRMLAWQAESTLVNNTNGTDSRFPLLLGLKGQHVNLTTGECSGNVSWDRSSGPYYKYLLKLGVYDTSRFQEYLQTWHMIAYSTMLHLASTPQNFPDITFLGRFDPQKELVIPESGHAECSAGADFLLGGRVLGDPELIEFGLRLVEGCHHIYEYTNTNLGPETFQWMPSECAKTTASQLPLKWRCDPPPSSARDFNDRNGFWITDASYNLRPEAIEAYYYAYRATNDTMYRDWAWDAWLAIDNNTRLTRGYASISNVDGVGDEVRPIDIQESFFFSSTLKYLYLIFSDDAEWQVHPQWQVTQKLGKDHDVWVYNAGGHPLRILSPFRYS